MCDLLPSRCHSQLSRGLRYAISGIEGEKNLTWKAGEIPSIVGDETHACSLPNSKVH